MTSLTSMAGRAAQRRFTIGMQLGLLVLIPITGTGLITWSCLSFLEHTEAEGGAFSIAGRQRMRAEQMAAYAQLVSTGLYDDERGRVRASVETFEGVLLAMEHGGYVEGLALPAPGTGVLPALRRSRELWSAWKARLLAVADLPVSDPAAVASMAWLRVHSGQLTAVAEKVMEGLERDSRALRRREYERLALLGALDLLLVVVGSGFARQRIVRPILSLSRALRAVQAGDFSARLVPDGFDEISHLTGSFNEMSCELGRLTEVQARFFEVVRHASDGVVMTDGRALISYLNPAAERMFDWPLEELRGRSLETLIPSVRCGAARDEVGGVPRAPSLSDGGKVLQVEGLHRDGSTFSVDVRLGSHRAQGETVLAAVIREAPERSKLAAKVMQMDRMIAVGTLAAGVAHEINNPLAYISANLRFVGEALERRVESCRACAAEHGRPLQEATASMSALLEALHESSEGAERIRLIVRDLKTFSRTDDDRQTIVDVRRVAESSVNMVWNEVKHRASLKTDLSSVPPVLGSEFKLGQVLINLLINAAQSIPVGAANNNQIGLRTFASRGAVHIEVEDTGSGIAGEDLPRIFDPFFTTKPVGQGTGLGLSICQGIVRDLGGEISVRSELGRGSTFMVVLPQAPLGSSAKPEGGAQVAPVTTAGTRARILVVDDEDQVCRAVVRLLADEHEVTAAASGREALEVIRAGEGFDLVLCDLMMPEMTGMELFVELTRSQPSLARRMIFMTGGAFTDEGRDFVAATRNVCLDKPFYPETLRAAIRECVQAERRAADVQATPGAGERGRARVLQQGASARGRALPEGPPFVPETSNGTWQ